MLSLFSSRLLKFTFHRHSSPRRLFFEPLERREVLTVPIIAISTVSSVKEGETGQFLVSAAGDPDYADIVITYEVDALSGATEGTDFEPLSGTVTIPAGETEAYIDIPTLRDREKEIGGEYAAINLLTTSRGSIDHSFGNMLIEENNLPAATLPGCTSCPPGSGDGLLNDWWSGAFTAGVGNSFSDSGWASHPVRYFDGTVLLTATDLTSSAGGIPWQVTRDWSNGPGYADKNAVGSGMASSERPYLLESGGGDMIGLVTNGHTAHYFNLNGSNYEAEGFVQDTLVHDTGNDQFVVTDTTGA